MIASDELPGIGVSRLRAMGVISPEMKATIVRFGEAEFTVGLWLLRFPNGGSWSLFVCPCGRRCRTIRLFEGGLACSGCLKARGLRPRVQLIATSKRAEYHLPRLLARLNGPSPRFRQKHRRSVDRRATLELSLKRTLIVARRAQIAKFEEDLGRL
jgi:hypothetical protein